jgi:curved DNA-binding protein
MGGLSFTVADIARPRALFRGLNRPLTAFGYTFLMVRPAAQMSLKMAREVLGVSSLHTPEEIRAAFREAAKRAHPDSGGDEGAFRQVVEAHRRLQEPPDAALTFPPAVYEPAAQTPPAHLEIGSLAAVHGGPVPHTLPDGRRIKIALPPGVRAGDTVRAAGVELTVYVRAEDGVIVRGDDLWITVHLPAATLRKGGRVSVSTPLGERSVWIDRKAAERGLIRVDDEGLPARGAHPRGHLFLRLAADAATSESAAVALLRRFAAAWAA